VTVTHRSALRRLEIGAAHWFSGPRLVEAGLRLSKRLLECAQPVCSEHPVSIAEMLVVSDDCTTALQLCSQDL
jgi:hypothetical protein